MYARFGLFIAGQWQASATGATAPVFSPVTEQSLGDCPVASAEDTEAAIAAAGAGFEAVVKPATVGVPEVVAGLLEAVRA